jgi:uncharacterized membrane protein YfcA
MVQLVIVGAIGLLAGVLSGVFGIGGGIVIVPLLILLLAFSATQAAGTSLAALLLPVGALGAWEYWRAGLIDLRVAAVLAIGLLVGVYLGARLGVSLPAAVVQRAFGVLLLIVGARFAFFA